MVADSETPIGRSDLPGEPLPDDLGPLLRTAVGWTHRRFRTASGFSGLPYGAITVLNRMRVAGAQSLTDLARWEGVSAPTMSQTVTRLLEGGFAERATDPHDRRRVLLSATAKGVVAAERWVDDSVDWIDAALAASSEEDRDTLRRAAHLLIDISRS